MAGMTDGEMARGGEESSPFYSCGARRGDQRSLVLKGLTERVSSGRAARIAPWPVGELHAAAELAFVSQGIDEWGYSAEEGDTQASHWREVVVEQGASMMALMGRAMAGEKLIVNWGGTLRFRGHRQLGRDAEDGEGHVRGWRLHLEASSCHWFGVEQR